MNARLDPRDRIRCGVFDCAETLGVVIEHDDTTDKVTRRVVALPFGWRMRPRDGVWTPTKHAVRHHAVLGTYKSRQAPRWANSPKMKASVPFVRVETLPAEVACPKCGFRQVLDALALRATATPPVARGAEPERRRPPDPPLIFVPKAMAEKKGWRF